MGTLFGNDVNEMLVNVFKMVDAKQGLTREPLAGRPTVSENRNGATVNAPGNDMSAGRSERENLGVANKLFGS